MLALPALSRDGPVVVIAFLRFVVATEIDPDEPSAVASCDDLSKGAVLF